MAGRVRVGAAHHKAPVGILGQRSPNLLAVDHPSIAVEHRLGAHIGQIRPGIGLGIALAPELLARQDRRHKPLLLLRRAVGNQRRPQQRDPHVGKPPRRPGLHVGLVEQHLLRQTALPAPQVGGKVDAQPAADGQLALPGDLHLSGNVLLAHPTKAPKSGEVPHQVLLKPRPYLVAKIPLSRVEVEIHPFGTLASGPMGMTLQEAEEILLAAGSPFEATTEAVNGEVYEMFSNRAGSLLNG